MSRAKRTSGTAAASPPVPADVLAARSRADCLVTAQQVQFAVDRLAVRIMVDLHEANPLVLCVMNGGLPFTAELLRRWDFPLELAYVHVSRYREHTEGRDLRWLVEPQPDLKGRTVLFVDDVLDHGQTLAAVVGWARTAGAASVRSAVLVDKACGRPRPLAADYAALECPDRYLFGCGMDYRGYWRNLPAIYALPLDFEGLDAPSIEPGAPP